MGAAVGLLHVPQPASSSTQMNIVADLHAVVCLTLAPQTSGMLTTHTRFLRHTVRRLTATPMMITPPPSSAETPTMTFSSVDMFLSASVQNSQKVTIENNNNKIRAQIYHLGIPCNVQLKRGI